MPEFCLTQISDTHLARRHQKLTDNFHRLSEHIDATRPDLVINSGDLAFDAPTSGDDLEFAKKLHDGLPVTCRYLPGNHDIGDNPTAVGPAPACCCRLAPSICAWSPPALCTSAGILPLAMCGISGRLPPPSSFRTKGRK